MATQFEPNCFEHATAVCDRPRPSSPESARIREFSQREIGFVHNPEFEKLALEDLGDVVNPGDEVTGHDNARGSLTAPTIPAGRLLRPDEERNLFRRYNFLKYRANVLRSFLNENHSSHHLVDEIEGAIRSAEQTRETLVRANMRLAASIARRCSRNESDFDELLAEASVILLGAVEKFDYSRGFRFSTYATHAIQRHLFRIQKRRHSRGRHERAYQENLALVANDNETPVADAEALQFLKRLWSRSEECLTSREQSILRQRFGLGENRQPQTLKQIAGDVGLSKERVRQIQIRALEKLRQFASEQGLWIEL